MKFKRLLSILLVTGVFVSNTGLNSLADTLSEDGRYETFKGDYLTIDNIIENNKVDIEIEGNTLINILGYSDLNINGYWAYKDGVGYMQLTDKTGTYKAIRYPLEKEVELNKEYTLFINITKNTMKRYGDEGGAIAKISLARDFGDDNVIFIQQFQTGVIKYVFRPTEIVNNRPFVEVLPNSYNGEFEYKDFMIIEGNHIDKDVEYFEGIKSVGEKTDKSHGLKISSYENKILNLDRGTVASADGVPYSRTDRLRTNLFQVSSNIISIKGLSDKETSLVFCYDENNNYLGKAKDDWNKDRNNIKLKDNTKYVYVVWRIQDNFEIFPKDYQDIIIYENINNSHFEVLLKEPLRGIEGGVKDKIIRKDGKWMIERNCGQTVLNGRENWYGWHSNEVQTNAFRLNFNKITHVPSSRKNTIISDTLKHESFASIWYGNAILDKSISAGDPNGFTDRSSIYIRNTDFISSQVNEFKEWLSRNPVTIVYELENPIYEPLNIPSSMNIYKGVTCILNNSIIPATMKVTVDRALNKAIESVEFATLNPTMENLSRARMWVNLVSDCSLKDQLQNEINSITNINDLQLERKSTSSNLDVYLKSQNMLSMSLNTNSVTFDGYSGTEDMEMLSAVNISINSSLSYSLNAYLSSEIANRDKSKVMPIDTLNIREESEGMYQTFVNRVDKLVLKDNCPKGNNLVHNIDLKLSSNLAHKADVYKAVIKFEAEQK